MVNFQEILTNLKEAKTSVTVGDIRTLVGGECCGWHVYEIHERKIFCVELSNMDVITVLHAKLFSVAQALGKSFQGTSEGETLTLKKNSTEIHFDKNMLHPVGEEFLLIAKFYNSANYADLWALEKRNLEGKSYIQPERVTPKNQ